jgi:integrase
VLLLFPRGTELRTAKWEELCDIETHDVNGDTVQVPAWRLPKGRSKMETDHIFPLSPEAIALFDKLRTITEKKSPVYCFPGRFKNKPA